MKRFALTALLFLLLLCPALTSAQEDLLAPPDSPQVADDAPPADNPDQGTTPALDPAPSAPTRSVEPAATTSVAPRFGVAEAFRSDNSTQLSLSWDRVIFSWPAIQPNGPKDWNADNYLGPDNIARDRSRGLDVVGLLQFTPGWAAQNPGDGQRSVPKNLSAPANSPDNYWAQFAGRMAAHYKGRIDRWVIWNEPEFRPGDKGAGQSYTWLGSDQDYYMLLKRGYQAI
ncbi:MAG TPA: hypothetical protein VHS28_00925, partial [Chloroflexota bacterium]|nr:hypothetical protein [Chloroflexota bacterium]